MSKLHYEIYFQGNNFPGFVAGDHARRFVASGTIDVTASMSAAVAIPAAPPSESAVPVLVLKVLGPDAVYVQFAARNQDAPAGTGAHAVADAAPRLLLDEVDGRQTIVPPFEGRFAAVVAASLS